MEPEYITITGLFINSYFHNDVYKIITYNQQQIITADPLKILSALKTQNCRVNYFLKVLKDIFKSSLVHRRYLVAILHFLILLKPNSTKQEILKKLKTSKEKISEILDIRKISLEEMSDREIFSMVCRFYPEYISASLCNIKDLQRISKICIRKVKNYLLNRPCSAKVESVKGIYLNTTVTKSRDLKFLLGGYKCSENSHGASTYAFHGYIIVAADENIDLPNDPYILLSSEPIKCDSGVNISLIPLAILKSLINFSRFYEKIKISIWDSDSISENYMPKIAYGFENLTNEAITNIIIGFKTSTILIYAPTDPQLESIELSVNRLLNRYRRFICSRLVLQGNIEKDISELVEDQYIARVFAQLSKDSDIYDDFNCKKYVILKAFEIFASLI